MNLQEALQILSDNQVTDSIQMLRRWIRQGKIKATMLSKKEGYIVDPTSLNDFIESKQNKSRKTPPSSPNKTNIDTHNTYESGLKDGLRVKESAIQEAISLREKELILKGLKEDTFSYSFAELVKVFSKKEVLKEHLMLLKITSVTLNVLGNWIYHPDFNILIQVDELACPNRTLKVRAKTQYVQHLFEHFEKNK